MVLEYTPKQLVSPTYLTTTNQTLYTAPTSTTTRITKSTITNVTSASITVDIYIVPVGETASDQNIVIDSKSIPANSTLAGYELSLHVLETGDSIVGKASANSSVNIIVSGQEGA